MSGHALNRSLGLPMNMGRSIPLLCTAGRASTPRGTPPAYPRRQSIREETAPAGGLFVSERGCRSEFKDTDGNTFALVELG
jgi:hypothetical protein